MTIWLDDNLCPFDDTMVWCKTALEVIELLDTGEVEFIHFDHDLGGALTGYHVAVYIEELVQRGWLVPPDYLIHSGNPVGARRIDAAMKSAFKIFESRRAAGSRHDSEGAVQAG